jgi:subtilisin family serine protease
MTATPTGTTGAKRATGALLALCALAISLLAFQESAPATMAPVALEAVPGEIIVRYKPGTDRNARAAAREQAGVLRRRALPLADTHLVGVAPGTDTDNALATLNAHPAVRYAEPNFIRYPQALPDDPRFGAQWNLYNTGQFVAGVGTGTAGADVSAPAAWDVATGSRDVQLAVLDTGIDYFHADLAANIWRNPGEYVAGEERNGFDDDGNGYTDDLYGWDFLDADPVPSGPEIHGTDVAGIAGAVGDNELGVAGVSWKVSLVPLRVCTVACSGADVIEAIGYAGAIGADVANMSFGSGGFSASERAALATASDTLFVAAAGNAGTDNDADPFYPCAYDLPNLICVTATDHHDQQGGSYGATSVDLGAPGVNVVVGPPDYRDPFSDDLEGTSARWDYTEEPTPAQAGKWRRVLSTDPDQVHVVEDSEGSNYPNNADIKLTLGDPIDLSGERGCFVRLDAKLDTEPSKDYLRVEARQSSSDPYTELTRVSGTTGMFLPVSASLSQFDGVSAQLRLRLTSDGQNTRAGASVDNVNVHCHDPDAYTPNSGTSGAAPHVAGAAALVKSHMPTLSVAGLRDRLLRTVDPLPSLQGKMVTGGRLSVARALTADLDAPSISITSRPPDLSASGEAVFGFSSSESGVRFECRLDASDFAGCSSPTQYSALADGRHTFAVRALDAAGNPSQPAEASWVVDTTGPRVSISSGPESSTSVRSASFAFTASEPAEAFECSLDGSAFAGCSSPASYDGLAVGEHSFAVRARDTAGNWTSTPASRTWTIAEGAAADAEGPNGDDPGTVLPPPDPADPGPKAWGLPTLAVRVPIRQTVGRTLRRGLKTIAAIAGACPCALTYTLRLEARLARAVGLIRRRAADAGRMPTIGRVQRSLSDPGRVWTRVHLFKRARVRLAHVRQLRARLDARLADRFGRAATRRLRVRLTR